MDKTNPSPGSSCVTWNRLSTLWGCWKDPLQSWGSPDACGELPGLYGREAGCEWEFTVSNCLTLASMSQAFPGKNFERVTLTLPITTSYIILF